MKETPERAKQREKNFLLWQVRAKLKKKKRRENNEIFSVERTLLCLNLCYLCTHARTLSLTHSLTHVRTHARTHARTHTRRSETATEHKFFTNALINVRVRALKHTCGAHVHCQHRVSRRKLGDETVQAISMLHTRSTRKRHKFDFSNSPKYRKRGSQRAILRLLVLLPVGKETWNYHLFLRLEQAPFLA